METPSIELESFHLQITPTPIGQSDQCDAENNKILFCWFEDLHEKLTVTSVSTVLIREYNPFNFILYPSDFFQLPFTYSESLKKLLLPSLLVSGLSEALIQYGEQIKKESKFNTLQFITNLTRQIHSDFIVETREEGTPFDAFKTFDLKKASCRDLSWMQIQLLRYMGIAARFVSGYFYIHLEHPNFELHSWVEVFLPGAGWVGFDPSNGILAGYSHISIAASAIPENTMPVTGTIRGNATSELVTSLLIQKID